MTTKTRLATFVLSMAVCLLGMRSTCEAQIVAQLVQQSASLGQLGGFKKRQAADDLLTRARTALDQGNLELADWYVSSAERLEIEYESVFTHFSDTPQKVREAINFRRAALEKSGVYAQQPAATGTTNRTPGVPVTLAGLDGNDAVPGAHKANAVALLNRAKGAIAEDNVVAAVGWYKSAVALNEQFGPEEYSPSALYDQLVQLGVKPEDLRLTPASPVHLPPPGFAESAVAMDLRSPASKFAVPDELKDPQSVAVNDGDAISSSSLLERAAKIKSTDAATTERQFTSQRQRVMQLLAQSQAALDRDEVELSKQFALRAQEIRLPEAAYLAGDTRPWMVMMEISKAEKRQGSAVPEAVAANQVFPAPGVPQNVPQAVNPQPPATSAGVAPTVYVQQNVPGVNAAAVSYQFPVQTVAGQMPASQMPQQQFIPQQVPAPQQLAAPQLAQQAPGQLSIPQQQPGQVALAQATQGINSNGFAPQQLTAPQFSSPPPAQIQPTPAGPQMLTNPTTSPNVVNGQLRAPEIGGMAPAIEPPTQPSVNDLITDFAPSNPTANDPLTNNAVITDLEPSDLTPSDAIVNEPLIPNTNPAPPLADNSSSTPAAEPAPDVTKEKEEEQEGLGIQVYRQGVAALGEGDLEEAEALFREAWKYESEFDEISRQSLQDHLQFVRQQIVRKTTEPAQLPRSTQSSPPTLLQDDPASEVVKELNIDGPAAKQATLEKLLSEITRKQVAVQAMKATEPKKAWDEFNRLRDQVARAEIDEEPRGQLLRRLERQISELEDYIEKNRSRIETDERNKRVLAEIDRRRDLKTRNQQQLAEMVEQFNTLMDEQRFPDAVVIAKKARELDPLNPVVENMIFKSQTARQIHTQMLRDDNFQRGMLASFDSIDESAVAPSDEWSMEFPRYWDDLTKRRKNMLADKQRRYTDVEMQIQKSLKKQVDVQFEDAPLSQVLEKLAKMANVNVYIDPEGLSAEGVTSDNLVSINLRQPVMLKSALNLILEPLHLSYVVQDEVLRITSEQVRDGDVYTETYNVADLVIPIPNFVPSYNIGLPGAIREAHRVLGSGYVGGAMSHQPMTLADNPGMGPSTTNASVLAQMGAAGMVPASMGGSTGFGPAGSGGGSQADFQTLIELITATIEPDTWEEVGGPGAIDGFPGNLSLVVSQTQDVHERIVDLLEQLRRLQDLQVTIEVRFIELNDDFFERIGIDFDFDIDDGNTGLTSRDVEGFVDDGPNVTVGLQPGTMTPTVDLDIPFTQGSFDAAVPAFGGFTPDAAANIGFAILSDIEAYFMIQASQGDTRSNVLTAPKVTLFNGQTAFVSNTSQRPFVTSVIPVVGDFAAAHQPVITVLTEGTSLSVQAVVSQDRRFIRLTLVPFFSQIGAVDTFTFDGITTSDTGTTTVDPSDDSNSVVNNLQQTTSGTTVQLPTFSFTTVNTTVSVPDGGTILLGGIKSLSEGRNERGVPMLSKLPYINRLFKNVGIGRDARSLMMMVTPRILIQEEQEELQLGTSTGP